MKQFNISNTLFKESDILLGWDPFEYVASNGEPSNSIKSSLNLDHDFGDNYKESRRVEPNVPFFLLSPEAVWRTWDVLQETTPVSLPKTPPSSGFLGLVFLVQHCTTIPFMSTSRRYGYRPLATITIT